MELNHLKNREKGLKRILKGDVDLKNKDLEGWDRYMKDQCGLVRMSLLKIYE
jgi:hypothetical protein